MALNVANVGAVKQDRKAISRPAGELGMVASGSIDGPLSRGWNKHRRCFPHLSRSSAHRLRRVVNDHRTRSQKVGNTSGLGAWSGPSPCTCVTPVLPEAAVAFPPINR